MIAPVKGPRERIEGIEKNKESVVFSGPFGRLKLEPKAADIIRVVYARDAFSEEEKPGVICREAYTSWRFQEEQHEVILTTDKLMVRVAKDGLALSYHTLDGKLLLKEAQKRGKTLEAFDAYRVDETAKAEVEVKQTPDGEKKVIRDVPKIYDRELYHTCLHLDWQDGEALYGLGQHEEGNLNLRGRTVYVHQANMKIAMPVLVSNLGYGILMDAYSPMVFHDDAFGSYLYTEADVEMDYYFLYGGNMDGVVKGYRYLTGKAAMLPRWAFGYVQSQERYETQQEILKTAEEYRRRGLGLDCIVLDWCSWKGELWGEKILDETRFPDPAGMMEELHRNNVHFMISIWPTMDEKSENYREFAEKKLLLPFSNLYNPLKKEARDIYWKQVERGLFRYGIDSWWCDSSEPFTPEWGHVERPDAAVMYREYAECASQQMPARLTNAYGLYHARTLYEGQRSVEEDRRVVNLTRSGYTGSQRYGTILWSGDTCATWETLQRQIPAGLNFCASGHPYWTVDIGAFFVKKGMQWYWDGDYEAGCESPAYRELYVRWYQYGSFLPIFRAHGTDTRREMWNYGEEKDAAYEALVKANRLRYRLMPYIYSAAGKAWKNDASIMRMLAFDFPQDERACACKDQYLFGESLMVCPVTKPMYYDRDDTPLEGTEKTRKVYLPAGAGWYDFWTGRRYEGGEEILADAPLSIIPLFVKAGSILPMGSGKQHAGDGLEKGLVLIVYPGADGEYELYEDSGDGYGYERGEYSTTRFFWNDSRQELRAKKDGKPVDTGTYQVHIVGCTSDE